MTHRNGPHRKNKIILPSKNPPGVVDEMGLKFHIRRLYAPATTGVQRGIKSYFWLLKILIPISFVTALLEYAGWIQRLDFILQPLMAYLNLPAAAALPILLGMLTGIYGCIAAMAVLPLSVSEMTVIAVFVLIAHNLLQEGIIQAKSGIGFVRTTGTRLLVAVITAKAVAQCLPLEPGKTASVLTGLDTVPSLTHFIQNWGLDMLVLCIKILFILLGIMILIEMMKAFNIIDRLVRWLSPVLRLMGLEKEAGVLWLTGILLGLSYGGAVIVEQAQELQLTPEQIEKLHLSIGINHSVIEDPLVFLSLGLNPFWMWVPRLIAAILSVYIAGVWFKLKQALERKKNPAA
jgi:hypothetical protein